MFSSTLLWVGLGLLPLVVVVLYNTPRAKAARKRRAEEHRRQEEERKEKERAEARQMENFRKWRLVVHIREKDGRKSSFEAVLIRTLLKSGITVESLPGDSGHAVAGGDTSSLKDGLLALVGTSWHKEGAGEDEMGHYKWAQIYCDYRLLASANDGVGKILGAGCEHWDSSHEESLANTIIGDLASILPVEAQEK